MSGGLSSRPLSGPSALDRMAGAAGDLWAGFVTPSRMAFAVMVASFMLTAVLVSVIVSHRFVAGPFGAAFARTVKDTEALATRKALQLSMTPFKPGDPPRLCVIGNSILAHDFVGDEMLRTAMKKASGRDWDAVLLATALQGPLDEATLADYATRSGPCLTVLGVSFMRFHTTAQELVSLDRNGRLGIRSDWADEMLANIGEKPRARTGIYVIDNGQYLVRRMSKFALHVLTGTHEEPRYDTFAPDKPLDGKDAAQRRSRILEYLWDPGKPDLALGMLQQTVRRLGQRGATVVLVEEPVSQDLFQTEAERSAYRAKLAANAAIAETLGVRYCRLSDSFQPPPGDFPDYLHLTNPAAQARVSEALASCVMAASKQGGA